MKEHSTETKRKVKFKDRINPGEGTSSSGGEEMALLSLPLTVVPKGIKVRRKKKKKVNATISATDNDSLSLPPIPTVPYPYCPLGILYHIDFLYAIVYAQAVAEKGFDIIFLPSTEQIPVPVIK